MQTDDRPGDDRQTREQQLPSAPAHGVTRREFLAGGVALAAVGIVVPPGLGVLKNTVGLTSASPSQHESRSRNMTIVCIIRYEIDPYQRDAFKEYAHNWGHVIPHCGGHLIGYFLPWQGTNYVGWGLIAFDSLASYEKYQARLRHDPGATKNFAFAQEKRFIVKEDRNFVEVVDDTFGIPAAAP